MRARELVATMRLDFGDVVRSRWLLSASVVYAVLAGVFVFVGLRESTVLTFSGMGRVLFSFSHALLLVLPLLAVTATSQVINRARDDGTLELLFSHPLSRASYFVAVSLTRYLALAVPLVVLVVALAIVAPAVFHEQIPWPFVGRALGISAALLWAFVGLGLAVSTLVRHQTRAMVYGLVSWAAAVALLDVGLITLMLQWQLNPRVVFFLAAINPVQAARLALLSGLQPDLGAFGPVGFYLATRLGSHALLALSLIWPGFIGAASWGIAFASFRKGDLV